MEAAATTFRWLSTGLQYLQCVSNGDTAVLYLAIGVELRENQHMQICVPFRAHIDNILLNMPNIGVNLTQSY